MKTVTLLKGDGIGPEIITSVLTVFKYLNIPIAFDEQLLGREALDKTGEVLPQATFDSIRTNKVALKAPYETTKAIGFRSVNVSLRQIFDLYVNIRPLKTLVKSPLGYKDIDLVILRENTEDLYIGQEEIISEDQEVHAIKKTTRSACERIIDYAFNYALSNHKNKVTAVHKANILKESDGLFLRIFNERLAHYPQITVNDLIVDNAAMQLVLDPQQFEVIVTSNLYGDILSDLAAGLIGGLGLAPSANIGSEGAIFEACHGCAPDIAGKDLANPTALILSSCLLLEYLNFTEEADKIKSALKSTLDNNYLTKDLGGTLGTKEFTARLISYL